MKNIKSDRINSYPRVPNRLMVVDWASLSYHQIHTLDLSSIVPRSYTLDGLYFNESGFFVSYPDSTFFHILKDGDGVIYNKRLTKQEFGCQELKEFSIDKFSTLSMEVQQEVLKIETGINQLMIWRNSIISRMLEYVQLFNPKDLVFALEGENKPWRNDVMHEYYMKPGKVHISKSTCGKFIKVKYDLSMILLMVDSMSIIDSGTNAKYNISTKEAKKTGEDRFVIKDAGKVAIEKVTNGVTFDDYIDFYHTDTGLNEKITKYIDTKIVPKYKGNRSKSAWEFSFNKSDWNLIRTEFAEHIKRFFKCIVVTYDDAEGDDVIYVAVNNMKLKYDDVIIVTRDSDMDQLIGGNVSIFNHVEHCMRINSDPFTYIQTKVLAGDTSDNIPGMCIPGKTTKVADAGAQKLWDATNYDPYATAKVEGWDDQYLRNRDLIILDFIPAKIKENVGALIETKMSENRTLDTNTMGVFNNTIDSLFSKLRSNGYHVLNDGNVQLNKSQYFNENANKDIEAANATESFIATSLSTTMPPVIDNNDWTDFV